MSVVIEHKKKKNVPKLRFTEFQEAWEEKKLANVINEYREKSKKQNEYEVLTSARKGIVLQKEYFKEGNRLSSRDNTGFNILPPDFITYRSRSDDGRFYFNKNTLRSTGIISIYYPVFNSKKDTELDFFLDTLNINWKTLSKFSVGTSQKVLSLPELKKVKLYFPSESEQQKIANFLDSVNKWIESLKAQKEKLEVYKKGMMKKIFNQEIRFKDDNGDDFSEWEEKKLGEVAIFRRGSFPQPYGLKKWYDDENGFPFVQVFDVGDGFRLKEKTKRKITDEAKALSVIVDKGTIVLTIQGSIGRIAITHYNACVDRTLLIFQSFKQPTDKIFFMYMVFLLFEIEKRKAPGGTIKTITKERLSSFKISLPSLSEQQKIADFLTSIDNLIKAKQTQIIKAQNWKKGLMQQLFV